MATVGNLALTLNDLRKRQAPDGTLDYIVEMLAQSNPIMQDLKMMEGNLPTGNQTTQRTSIPEPSIRRFNQGVGYTKTSTRQIVDTCMKLEDRSLVDVEILKLYSDKEAFRASEDAGHIEGFAQKVAQAFIYGDIDKDPEEFNGLAARYNVIGGEKNSYGHQVISAGTPGTKTNTSMFLVGFGDRTVAGIYPKNGYAGLKMQDLGEADAFDKDGKPYRALQTLFQWNIGLTVRDPRAVAALRNIDVKSLSGMDSAGRLAVINKLVEVKNRIRNLQAAGVSYYWYVNDDMQNFIEQYLLDKNNVHVTRQELMGKMPELYLMGIPVHKLDCMTATEAAVPNAK